jgi:hypothetical protein
MVEILDAESLRQSLIARVDQLKTGGVLTDEQYQSIKGGLETANEDLLGKLDAMLTEVESNSANAKFVREKANVVASGILDINS